MASVVGPYVNDLTGFSFILPIFSIQRANEQKTIKLERKGLLGFKIDDGNSPNDGYGNF